MNNDCIYIELQYFGEIKCFSRLIECTNAFFLPNVRNQKSNHLNRAMLMGANGPLLLTIPLVGGRDKKQLFKDVQISYSDPWQRTHWRGIVSAYRKSPWFDDYAPGLEKLFQLREKFLIDLNLKTIEWTLERLKLKLDILAETDNSKTTERSLSSNQNALQPSIHYPVYQQVFADRFGFKPNLSTLDLIFCKGPQARDYLQSINFFE